MAQDENDIPFIDPTLIDLIGNPSDIDDKRKKDNFPFFNKSMQLGNNSRKKTRDLLDDFELAHLARLTGKRRYELRDSEGAIREEYIRNRTYLEAVTGLSEQGFAVKQLAGVQKTIEYKDNNTRGGGMLGFLGNNRNKGNDQ